MLNHIWGAELGQKLANEFQEAMTKKRTITSHQNDTRVRSVQEFVRIACDCRDEWIEGANYFDPWFRGQRCASWALEPGIFRLDLLKDEDEIRAEFIRRAEQYVDERIPNDFWGWYFVMQHYGAPTRLLDWTDSALVALFFALSCPLVDYRATEDAAVWVLDPMWLNRIVLNHDNILATDHEAAKKYLARPYAWINGNADTYIRQELPAAIDPPHVARRVSVQRSHFVIFGHDRDGLTRIGDQKDARLRRILVDKDYTPRMRADLGTLGITETSIFPDLKGLSDELTRYYLGDWPPDNPED